MARNLQSEQRVRILDLISEGQIAGLCDVEGNILSHQDRDKGILVDLTPVKSPDGSTAVAGIATDFRLGAANQPALTGFPSSEQEVPVESQVSNGTPIIRAIPAGSHNSLRISIRVPALYRYSVDGTRFGASVQFRVDVKRSVESVWKKAVDEHAGSIQGETLYPYVRQYRVELYGVGPWDVRVTRDTPNTSDPTKLQNDTWWQSYTLISDYRLSFRHSAIAAIEMEAKQNQSIRPRAYRIKGSLVRVPSNYDPETRNYAGVWDGNFAGCAVTLTSAYTAFSTTMACAALTVALPNNSPIKITSGGVVSEAYLSGDHAIGVTSLAISPIPRAIASGASGWGYLLKWTNNPAWIWFDVATHRRYGVGQYVPEATIDRWGLYSISRYCDGVDADGNFVGVDDGKGGVEPRFACSVYIASAADAYRVLSDIASAFRAMIYWGSGLIVASQDAPKEPRFTFTNANVVGGDFSYSSSARKSRHTMAYVRWNDPDDYYKAKLEQVVGDPEDIRRLGSRDASISAFGCTSRGQAIRLGKWLLLTEKYEQEMVSFRSGLEGARCRPGDIIRIRDRTKTENRMHGRVKSIGSDTLELDAPVVIEEGAYSLVVTKDDGEAIDLPVTNGTGTHQILAVTGSLAGISPNAVWILRTTLLEPTLWRILNSKELERHVFEVSALKYVEGKFANVELGVAISLPNTTDLPPRTVPAAPGEITITSTTIETGTRVERRLNVSWQPSVGKNVRGYRVEFRVPDGEWLVAAPITAAITMSILVASAGIYEVRVTTLGFYGLESLPRAASYFLIDYVTPDAPTGLTASAGTGKAVQLTWDKVSTAAEYAVYRASTDDPGAAVKIGEISALAFVDTRMTLDVASYYWVTAISAVEKESVKSASATATPSSVIGPEGPQGEQGIPGANGTNGSDGEDGQTSYFHIAYANAADGSSGFNHTSGVYVGTYVDFTAADSVNYADYTWRLWKGADGEDGTNGIPGTNGANGQTSYLHIKYSDDGGTTFTASSGETIGKYIGTKVDFTLADSATPSDYTWILLQGYVETTPPTNPAAPTYNSGSSYLTGDGTVMSRIVINVPAMPTGGFILNVLFRKTGATGWIVADQWDNARTDSPRTSTIDDLSPNVQYDVAVQAFTFDLAPSAIIAATGSPFTAPNKASGPANPTGFTGHAPSSSNPIAPRYFSGTQIYGTTIKYTRSADRDAAYYDFGISGDAVSAPSSVDTIVQASADKFVIYSATTTTQRLWVRTRDRTGNYASWVDTGVWINFTLALGAGNMSEQNSSDVSMSGVKIGSGSSVRKVVAVYPFNQVYNTVGGAATEQISVDLTNRGFSVAPDKATIDTGSTVYRAQYDYGASSSTSAKFTLQLLSGANIPAANALRITGDIVQYV